MPETRTILKIFLASPGDLSDERRTMKSVVDEINGQFANDSGYHVELVGWEDTISGIGRPQAIINAELERCEFFVGLMWKRWGTPPDNAGTSRPDLKKNSGDLWIGERRKGGLKSASFSRKLTQIFCRIPEKS